LSLENLLNIPIASASKKSESLYDAPLSSYTITKADIEKSGVTSIMEALRLAPGVVVREVTNGNYDIHLRGFDNVLRTSSLFSKQNNMTLVMIDDRPVFNHNLGGTMWETLPVDLNDVEQIEIVRGPSAPLFGPNAVTGVINIMTKRMNNKSSLVTANVQGGTAGTVIANANLGKTFNNKFSAMVSGNYQQRDRFDENYFFPFTDSFVPLSQIPFSNAQERYPNPTRALQKSGMNSFITYKPSKDLSFDLSVGAQTSDAQKIVSGALVESFVLFTHLTTDMSNTQYANLNSKIYGMSIRTSYINGSDVLSKGGLFAKYDYGIADLTAEYGIELNSKIKVTPGISYHSATYNDLENAVQEKKIGFLNAKRNISTTSGFIRTDMQPIKNLRVVGALRFDKFSSPDDVYLAYQLASTYNITQNNLIRAVVSRSNSGSFIANNYMNMSLDIPMAPGLKISAFGNENLTLFQMDMIEFGYRAKFTSNLHFDVDLFRQVGKNMSVMVMNPLPQDGNIISQFTNIPMEVIQNGLTASINFVPNNKIQVKPFITIQKTMVVGLPLNYNIFELAVTSDEDHKNTPNAYGGFFFNYRPISKLNVNFNGYYLGDHTQYDVHQTENAQLGQTKGKMLISSKASYTVIKNLDLFVSARNLFNNQAREFYATDHSGGLYLMGASLNINQ
ncbi:MAG: TonB-dependent receptor, partial [Bacteroidota bacterium]|nr:TonB-dependent receptor [Bacteroidota bacterium]